MSSSFPELSKEFCVTFLSSLDSDRLSCSCLYGDFDVVRLEEFFTAFEKINSRLGFSLRSFRMACSLGSRCFVWN